MYVGNDNRSLAIKNGLYVRIEMCWVSDFNIDISKHETKTFVYVYIIFLNNDIINFQRYSILSYLFLFFHSWFSTTSWGVHIFISKEGRGHLVKKDYKFRYRSVPIVPVKKMVYWFPKDHIQLWCSTPWPLLSCCIPVTKNPSLLRTDGFGLVNIVQLGLCDNTFKQLN